MEGLGLVTHTSAKRVFGLCRNANELPHAVAVGSVGKGDPSVAEETGKKNRTEEPNSEGSGCAVHFHLLSVRVPSRTKREGVDVLPDRGQTEPAEGSVTAPRTVIWVRGPLAAGQTRKPVVLRY